MNQVQETTIKQLASNDGIFSVIQDINKSSEIPLCIKDADGRILLGSNGHDTDHKYPVFLDSKIIGWVVGGENASTAASFLTYIAREETKKTFPYTPKDMKMLNTLSSRSAVLIKSAKNYNELKNSFVTVIDTLIETLDKRDPYTAGHTRRVKNYCMFLGKQLGLSNRKLRTLHLASILRDIAKIGVKDRILCKNGKLTAEEYEEIKKHAIYGWEILRHIKTLEDVLPGVKHHHERYDGKGYPDGRGGKDIDIVARIIAVTDAFDAMTFDRPYKDAMTIAMAFEELKKNSGTQFDPEIVGAFATSYEDGEFSHNEIMLCFKRGWNFSFHELE